MSQPGLLLCCSIGIARVEGRPLGASGAEWPPVAAGLNTHRNAVPHQNGGLVRPPFELLPTAYSYIPMLRNEIGGAADTRLARKIDPEVRAILPPRTRRRRQLVRKTMKKADAVETKLRGARAIDVAPNFELARTSDYR